MKTSIISAALAAAVAASPAMAQDAAPAADFGGARVGAEIGFADDDAFGTDTGTWGVNAGYDFDMGSTVVGITAGYSDAFDDDNTGFRELSVSGRFGGKLAPRTLLYGTAGYSNVDFSGLPGSIDGVKVGVGVEQKFGGNAYGNIETRYGNYQLGLELYQTVIGVGFRF